MPRRERDPYVIKRPAPLAERIPEGQKGTAQITHEADGDKTITNLLIDGESVMTDRTTEWLSQLEAFLAQASGRVLVGGLGLGLIIKPLWRNPAVLSVDILEISQDVIDLVWEHVNPGDGKIRLHQADVFSWDPEPLRLKWDQAYFDLSTKVGDEDFATLTAKYTPFLKEGGEIKRWEPLGGEPQQ